MTEAEYPPPPQPDMRCGDCSGRLVFEWDRNRRYGSYTHAGAMMDRHGSWPVESWNDDGEVLTLRWSSWKPPSWEYPPLPGVVVNAAPPEPPVGTKLASAHRPGEVVFYRAPDGWRMPEWDDISDDLLGSRRLLEPWLSVARNYGPLVIWEGSS